jgi:DNA-binding SARP family transcriptional activator
MPRVCLALLGNFEAQITGGSQTTQLALPTRKAEALIAYLAVRDDTRHRRDHLSELLWGDVPKVQARHSLRQTLSDIRAALRPYDHIIQTSDDAVALRTDIVHVDVRSLERLVRRRTRQSIALACALYRGDFLEGFSVREDEFDAWAAAERTRMRQLAVDAYQTQVRHLMAVHDTSAAIDAALRLVALEPLQEWVHRTLMMLYWERGQLAAALRQYELCADLLARELGIAPDRETEQLWHDLLVARARKSPLDD